MTYLRAMERQRILERVGAIAMLREMQRRERVRQAKEKGEVDSQTWTLFRT